MTTPVQITNGIQNELNFQNSVSEALPAFIDRTQSFQDQARRAIDEAGLANYGLGAQGEGELTLTARAANPPQTELRQVSIATNLPEGVRQRIRIEHTRTVDEDSFFFRETYESSEYTFVDRDGVTHLEAQVINTPWVASVDKKPEPISRTDDREDLERLREMLEGGDALLAADLQCRQEVKAFQERMATPHEQQQTRRSVGRMLLGLARRRKT